MNKLNKRVSYDDEQVVLRSGRQTADRMALETLESRHAGGPLTDEQMRVEHLSSYSKIILTPEPEVIDHLLSWLDVEGSDMVHKIDARDHNISRHSRKLYRSLKEYRDIMPEDDEVTAADVAEFLSTLDAETKPDDVFEGLEAKGIEFERKWHISYKGDRVWESPRVTEHNEGRHVLATYFFTMYRADWDDNKTTFSFVFGRVGNTRSYQFSVPTE